MDYIFTEEELKNLDDIIPEESKREKEDKKKNKKNKKNKVIKPLGDVSIHAK